MFTLTIERGKPMARRIEDYALIGDFESAALVARDGSIDWLCWPRFDSGALFAALLGSASNGRWTINTADAPAKISRRYRGNTLVLETEFETEDGIAAVIDFMPVGTEGKSHVVRLVEGRCGTVGMATEFVLRFDYGLIVPWITRIHEEGLKAIAGPDMVVLRSQVPIEPAGFKHKGTFTIKAGQTIPFVLSYGKSYNSPPAAIDPTKALKDTEQFWEDWSKSCSGGGPYAEEVLRSLITLKALTFKKTGGIAAAPTTSLPEEIGGVRNWDYRYCWMPPLPCSPCSIQAFGRKRMHGASGSIAR